MDINYKGEALANVKAKEIDDFVAATMELLIQKGAFTNLLSDLNDYVALREIFPKHKKSYQGEDWTFNVAIADDNTGNGTAKFTKLFDTDESNRIDVIKKGKISPCFFTANFTYDVRERVLNHGSTVQRIDFIKTQGDTMYQSYFNLAENAFWGTPKGISDDITPFGLKFWMQRATDSVAAAANTKMGSFEAVNPAPGWFRAGIDSTAHPRWSNWSAQYESVTAADLIKKMRYAARKTTFKSPLKINEPTFGKGRAIYVTTDTLMSMEEVLEAQNMNLGNDLASKDGMTRFKGNPVYSVNILDDDPGAPVYMIDWSTFGATVLAGWDKKVSAPEKVANQHNVRAVFLDGSLNFGCTNLRNQAVISKKVVA